MSFPEQPPRHVAFQTPSNGIHSCKDHGRVQLISQPVTPPSFQPPAQPVVHPNAQTVVQPAAAAPLQPVGATSLIAVPKDFKCPLTLHVMRDPVATCDGNVFERSAIEKWLRQGYRTSPITGLELETLTISPQLALQAGISAFMAHPSAPSQLSASFQGGDTSTCSGDTASLNQVSAGSGVEEATAPRSATEVAEMRRLLQVLQSELHRAEDAVASGSTSALLSEPMQMARLMISSNGASAGSGSCGVAGAGACSTGSASSDGVTAPSHPGRPQLGPPVQNLSSALGAPPPQIRPPPGNTQPWPEMPPVDSPPQVDRDPAVTRQHSPPSASGGIRPRSQPRSLPQRRDGSPVTRERSSGPSLGPSRTPSPESGRQRPVAGNAPESDRRRPSRISSTLPSSANVPTDQGPRSSIGNAIRNQVACRNTPRKQAPTAQQSNSAVASGARSRLHSPGAIARTAAAAASVGRGNQNVHAAGARKPVGNARWPGGAGSVSPGGVNSQRQASPPRQVSPTRQVGFRQTTAPCQQAFGPPQRQRSSPRTSRSSFGGTNAGRNKPETSVTIATSVGIAVAAHPPGSTSGKSREVRKASPEDQACSAENGTSKSETAWRARREPERTGFEQGANDCNSVNSVDLAGRTPLMHIAGEGDVEGLRRMVSQGANVNATDECRCTALMYAATYGHLEAVRCLAENGAEVEAKSQDGWTPLITAAYNGHLRVAQCLLEHRAYVEAADERGWTSLMHVAFNGDNNTLRCLLEFRSAVSTLDSDGRDALVYAAFNGHLENARCLLDVSRGQMRTAQIDGARDTALLFAAIRGHVQVLDVLIQAYPATTETRHAAQKLAADHGHVAVVEFLSSAKA